MENSRNLRQRFSYWNSNLEAHYDLKVTITALHIGLYGSDLSLATSGAKV